MKRILVQQGLGANQHIRQSLVNAWRSSGCQTYFWDDSGKSAFDVFMEFQPDVVLSSTWQLNRSLVKNLIKYKPSTILYADAWGEVNNIDLQKYPVGIATKEQIDSVAELYRNAVPVELISNHSQEYIEFTHGGWPAYFGSDCQVHSVLVSADITQYYPRSEDENYKVQLAYTGGYWPYKSRNINKYLLPLLYPNTKDWKIRIFGGGWNVVQSLGITTVEEEARHYTNADIIPHMVEPHASDIYADIPLRYFQVAACKGFGLSIPCVGIKEIFTEDELVVVENGNQWFNDFVYYLNHPEITAVYRQKAYEKVLAKHTGFDRCIQLGKILGIDITSLQRAKDKYIKENICY